MSESPRAVFLSYASQDAEAAQRLCDALRAAGVEVWFDRNELVGGDAWDAKIRGQIADCALFVPIISANTQARREGYFRLEWKLAAQRTHMISDDTPFLLPVVIDDTRDADARVPAEFKNVQWTRLAGEGSFATFCARVSQLLGREEESSPQPAEKRPNSHAGGARRSAWSPGRVTWMVGGTLLAGASVWLVLRMFAPTTSAPRANAAASETTAPRISPAEALVAKARPLVGEVNANRANLEAASELLSQAVALDPQSASAWGLWAQLDCFLVRWSMDRRVTRLEEARRKVARALALDGQNRDALLGQAMILVFSGSDAATAEAETVLRRFLERFPEDPEGLVRLADVLRMSGRVDEAIALCQRVEELPGSFALGAENRGLAEYLGGRPDDALATFNRVLARGTYFQSLRIKALIESEWTGDLAAAAASVQQLPSATLLEDFAAAAALQVYRFRREHERSVELLRSLSRDYLRSNILSGPRSLFLGDAQAMAGRPAAAAVAWTDALQVVERSLAANPGDRVERYWRAALLARLGRREEARKEFQTVVQLFDGEFPLLAAWPLTQHYLGLEDDALARLEQQFVRPRTPPTMLTSAGLRLDPLFDAYRALPRFQAIAARAESDPRFGPVRRTETGAASVAPASRDEKSVAVLAFANLSEDKSNEYFSDGVSEEVLNVLAKVPGLKVSARTSAFYFKGRNVPIAQIAQQLGVAYVVEGSVRKAGDKVRITAQLIKAADGFHVWSETFTRDLKDVFAVQDEIARLIAQALEVKLARGTARGEVDPANYERLLEARSWARRESNADWRRAVEIYRETLARDANQVDAWAELARTYVQLGRFGGMPVNDAMREARAAAQRALELDPNHVTGLVALGWVQRTADWDWRGARRSFERALELAPGNPSVMADAAVLFTNIGRRAEAVDLGRRAAAADPLNARVQTGLGFVLGMGGDFEAALVPLRRAVELAPAIEEARAHMARALLLLGRVDDAAEVIRGEPNEAFRTNVEAIIAARRGNRARSEQLLQQLIRDHGDELPTYVANVYAQTGRLDEAFQWIDRALARRDSGVVWAKSNAYLTDLRADPRYDAVLRRLGLADDQLR